MTVQKSFAFACLLFVFTPGECAHAAPLAERPNIVLIVADDLGFSDLGCYGSEIKTPHLDRLAHQGLRFTQFHNNAICVSTRASLMTGLYPRQVSISKLKNCVTIAEVLRDSGYQTLMAGKWHLAGHPRDRGFERYYGLLTGCCNHFNPGQQRLGEPSPGKKHVGDEQPFDLDGQLVKPFTPPREFYSTDAFTNAALTFLNERRNDERPFFLYVAYTVPHYPLHAPPEDITRYRGKYLDGWDRLREARFQRLRELGLIGKSWELSPRSPHAPAWDDIEDKDAWDLKMAVYAAMVDRLDRNIGRILEKIRVTGEEDNTLVLFLSDNGASDENRTSTPNIPPGPVESYWSVDLPWATLSNTPFRHFKRWNHEGGTATPLIAHWPQRISARGEITHKIGHVIDIMATIVEIASATYPTSYHGSTVQQLEGRSFLSTLLKPDSVSADRPIFWNRAGLWRSVRVGKWKLVSPDYTQQYNPWRAGRKGRLVRDPPVDSDTLWELYDMENDRTEVHNLAHQQPERVQRMATLYAKWDRRVSNSAHDSTRSDD